MADLELEFRDTLILQRVPPEPMDTWNIVLDGTIIGTLMVTGINTSELFVEDIFLKPQFRRTTGTKLRGLLNEIKQEYPKAQSIVGNRLTGSKFERRQKPPTTHNEQDEDFEEEPMMIESSRVRLP